MLNNVFKRNKQKLLVYWIECGAHKLHYNKNYLCEIVIKKFGKRIRWFFRKKILYVNLNEFFYGTWILQAKLLSRFCHSSTWTQNKKVKNCKKNKIQFFHNERLWWIILKLTLNKNLWSLSRLFVEPIKKYWKVRIKNK